MRKSFITLRRGSYLTRLMALLLLILTAMPQMNAQVKQSTKPNGVTLNPHEKVLLERAKSSNNGNMKGDLILPTDKERVEIGMKCAEVLIGGTDIATGKLIDASLIYGLKEQIVTFGQAKSELIDSIIDPVYYQYLFGENSSGLFLCGGYARNGVTQQSGVCSDQLGQANIGDALLFNEFPNLSSVNDGVTLQLKFQAKVSGTLVFDYVMVTGEMQYPNFSDPFALFIRDCGTATNPEENDFQNIAYMPSELSGVAYHYSYIDPYPEGDAWGDSIRVESRRMQEIVESEYRGHGITAANYVTYNHTTGNPFNYYKYGQVPYTGFNGATKKFEASFKAKKDHIYQIRISTGDADDTSVNTGVYLRASSLCVKPEPPQVFGVKIDSVFYYEPGQTIIPATLQTNTQGTVYFMNKQCSVESEFDNPENQLITPVEIGESMTGVAYFPTKDGAYYAYLKTEAGDFSLPNPFWIAPSQPTELITITYDANGGKFADYDNKDILMRSQIRYTFTEEPDFKPVYNDLDIFNRWCIDEEGTTPFKFGNRIETDTILYASYGYWDITYDGMGGSVYDNGNIKQKLVKKCDGFNYSFPESQSYSYHIFKGWYLEDTFETKVTNGEQAKIFGAHTLYAKWVKDPAYIKKLTYSVVGQGTVDVTDCYDSSVHYASGDSISTVDFKYYIGDDAYYNVWATPSENYTFKKFVINGDEYTNNPQYFTPGNQDVNIVAYFVGKPCEITVTSNDEILGTVEGGGEYPKGEEVTLTATVTNPEYHFLGWALASAPAAIISTANPYVFKCEGDASYVGVFTDQPVVSIQIEASPLHGGTVTMRDAAGNPVVGSVISGSTITIEATASEGYAFQGWYDKNTDNIFSKKQTYTFEANTNFNLEARFTDQVIWVRVKKGN